jgi:hypothetical protein
MDRTPEELQKRINYFEEIGTEPSWRELAALSAQMTRSANRILSPKPKPEDELHKLPGESESLKKAVIDNLIVVSKLQTGMGGKFYIDVMQSFIDECKKGFKYDMDCELKLNQLKRLIIKLKSLNSVNEIFEHAFSGTVSILVGDAGTSFKVIADKITDPFDPEKPEPITNVKTLHEMCDDFTTHVIPILSHISTMSKSPMGRSFIKTLHLQHVISEAEAQKLKMGARGGRRTRRHKRSGHKKRSGNKRSGHKSRRR